VPNTPDVKELACVLATTGAGALALLHPKLGAGEHGADGVGAAPPVLVVTGSGALALLYPALVAAAPDADSAPNPLPLLVVTGSGALALLHPALVAAAPDANGAPKALPVLAGAGSQALTLLYPAIVAAALDVESFSKPVLVLSGWRAFPCIVVVLVVPSCVARIVGACEHTDGPYTSAASRMASAVCPCAGKNTRAVEPGAWP
jgi:hypothetical protein